MSALKLGYWKARGFTHPIRQLLHITKLNFENITWDTREELQAQKEAVFFNGDKVHPFPNCPFLIDGDFVLTESSAIPLYICHKANRPDLLGKNLVDQSRVRQIEGVAFDLLQTIGKHVFDPEKEKKIQEAAKEGGPCRQQAGKLSEFLAEKDFLVGYLTYADLLVVHYLLVTRNFCLSLGIEDPYKEFGNLDGLCRRIGALPELEGFAYNYPYVLDWVYPWFKDHPLEEE